MFAPHTVTLVNVITSKNADYTEENTLHAVVLHGVFLDVSDGSRPSQNGSTNDYNATLLIPEDVDARDPFNGRKMHYVSPEEYKGDDNTWTVKACGSTSNIDCYFVKGERSAHDYRTMRMTYPNVYDSVSVTHYDYGSASMRHWEVRGR